eukprot:11191082-Lingulodinium_polyedra.AAC.1
MLPGGPSEMCPYLRSCAQNWLNWASFGGNCPWNGCNRRGRCRGLMLHALRIWSAHPSTLITNWPSSAARWRTVP